MSEAYQCDKCKQFSTAGDRIKIDVTDDTQKNTHYDFCNKCWVVVKLSFAVKGGA